MLDDLAIAVEAEDIDAGIVVVAGPVLLAMQHDKVAIGKGALDLDSFPWPFVRHAFEIVDKTLFA